MRRPVGRRCTICNHPTRPQIDLAIATGVSKRAVAERFGVSRDAVWRHAQAHLTTEMRAALATRLLQREGDTRRILLEEGAGVTEALKAIRGPLFGLFLAAADSGDNKAAAALSARLHENLALVAKLTGELVPHAGTSITNILLSPDFQRLRTELMRVLAHYPEAQAEVTAVFRQAGLRAASEMGASAAKTIDALPERDGFELAVPREISLVECIAVGAAQPIETAGYRITPAHLDPDNAKGTENF